jgi:hypothetical protein
MIVRSTAMAACAVPRAASALRMQCRPMHAAPVPPGSNARRCYCVATGDRAIHGMHARTESQCWAAPSDLKAAARAALQGLCRMQGGEGGMQEAGARGAGLQCLAQCHAELAEVFEG